VAARHHRHVIGLVDIGGTKVAAAVAVDGVMGDVRRRPTPAGDPVRALAELLDEARRGEPLEAISVSAPGPFDRERGALLAPPGMPPSWQGLRLRDELGARYECPVSVENDANCAALAEARWGAARGLGSAVYFTVSTGIGTGVVRDGRLVTGRHDTEGGHQVLWPEWAGGPPCHCGGHGCLEALASGRAIERRFGVSAAALTDATAWADVGRWLGLGAVNAVALHDPEAVIFGGGVCAAWDRFSPALRATVESHLRLQPVPRLERGSLGEDRNLLGALALAPSPGNALGSRPA
jgi:glucokinase